MKFLDSHLSDQQLLLDLEGELPPNDRKLVRAHLDACWSCRARRQELESTICDFVRNYQQSFDADLPSAAGPRVLLKSTLESFGPPSAGSIRQWFALVRGFALAAVVAACGLLVLALARSDIRRRMEAHPQSRAVSLPDARLTPGATLRLDRSQVCSEENPKNKPVPRALQRQVLAEYGIPDAEPKAYEIDYLVTPALGGADDIHNLWPQSYSATVWNARVKDELEDRLREMVCDGSIDLTSAQREIAGNWIAAYKKYFHTDEPLSEDYP